MNYVFYIYYKRLSKCITTNENPHSHDKWILVVVSLFSDPISKTPIVRFGIIQPFLKNRTNFSLEGTGLTGFYCTKRQSRRATYAAMIEFKVITKKMPCEGNRYFTMQQSFCLCLCYGTKSGNVK